jgi:hypothetical protein
MSIVLTPDLRPDCANDADNDNASFFLFLKFFGAGILGGGFNGAV